RDSVKITVFYLPNPNILIYPDYRVCLNSTVSIKVKDIKSISWSTPMGSSYFGDSIVLRINDFKFSGDFTLTAIDTNGCSVYLTQKIQVLPLPYV
ncbi:MAG: hypothetical protein ACO259_08755, partial [Bacteroidia bacterium]